MVSLKNTCTELVTGRNHETELTKVVYTKHINLIYKPATTSLNLFVTISMYRFVKLLNHNVFST